MWKIVIEGVRVTGVHPTEHDAQVEGIDVFSASPAGAMAIFRLRGKPPTWARLQNYIEITPAVGEWLECGEVLPCADLMVEPESILFVDKKSGKVQLGSYDEGSDSFITSDDKCYARHRITKYFIIPEH